MHKRMKRIFQLNKALPQLVVPNSIVNKLPQCSRRVVLANLSISRAFSCHDHTHDHHHHDHHNSTHKCCQGDKTKNDSNHKCCGGNHKQGNHSCSSSNDGKHVNQHHDHDHSHSDQSPLNTSNIDSDECWHCGKSKKDKDLFCSEPSCGRVQALEPKKLNLFAVFEIPQSYFIDEKQIDNTYKELQKKLHPDKFATKTMDEKNVSTSSSSAINFAYQTLKDPVERAQYLIWLIFEKHVFDEHRTLEDPEFMMEIFELREEIQDNRGNSEHRVKLIKYITQAISTAEQIFEQAIQSKDSKQAMHQAMKLKYYFKMLEELNE